MKNKLNKHFPQRSRDLGFTLVEVLVSILILSAGLIGTAIMQLNAFRTTEQSNLHDTALALAAQIADEIRANDQQMRLAPGGGASANPFVGFSHISGTTSTTPTTTCYASSCNPDQWATQLRREWASKVNSALPDGHLEICRDVTVSGWCTATSAADVNTPVAVKIGWREKDVDGRKVEDTSPRLAIFVSPYTQ